MNSNEQFLLGLQDDLYPPFQEELTRALWLLTKAEWRWPLFLLEKLPYYWERRRV